MNRIPLLADPIAQFAEWFELAKGCRAIEQANAACLSTVDPEGFPDGRMILLKAFDARGFVFYTNKQSRKGDELAANPQVALLFHWKSLLRQIRIEGVVEHVTDAEADAYYNSRPKISKVR